MNLNKPTSYIDRVVAILFGVIVSLMLIAIVFRYVLNSSLYWSDEIVRYLFVWLTFLGAAIAIRDKAHIRVDFFANKLPFRFRKIVKRLDDVLLLSFLLFITIGGFIWVFQLSGSYSPALSLPLNWLFYAALPTTSLIAFIYAIKQFQSDIRNTQNERRL
ncbi:MAG: TRAP transporter small permease [Bacteroidetes bacterium]|jgi:C4-dicarboxylate transporter DctQ subunit|nr:TRAP transporter small permease [Bacteroidota bacterium]MDF1866154.1 TRAP transporter small permease [Saprospiraceae bacterium]